MERTLRKVTTNPASAAFFQEARFLLDLRNEPEARRMFVDTDVISWETHLAWYSEAVNNPKRHIYIIQYQSADAGMVRLDGDEEDSTVAELSITLAPDFRGKGLGPLAIQKGCEEGAGLGYQTILARIKNTNQRSIQAFQKVGFVTFGEEEKGGCKLISLILDLSDTK
jgi:L-amino acid N-acyltransferase YncA